MKANLGKYIDARIRELGYTQKEVGDKINRTQKTIASLLNSDSMSTQRMIELSIALDQNLFQFFTNPGGPLEKFAPKPAGHIVQENESLSEKVAQLEAQLSSLSAELAHIKEISTYMKLTLDAQKAYIQTIAPDK